MGAAERDGRDAGGWSQRRTGDSHRCRRTHDVTQAWRSSLAARRPQPGGRRMSTGRLVVVRLACVDADDAVGASEFRGLWWRSLCRQEGLVSAGPVRRRGRHEPDSERAASAAVTWQRVTHGVFDAARRRSTDGRTPIVDADARRGSGCSPTVRRRSPSAPARSRCSGCAVFRRASCRRSPSRRAHPRRITRRHPVRQFRPGRGRAVREPCDRRAASRRWSGAARAAAATTRSRVLDDVLSPGTADRAGAGRGAGGECLGRRGATRCAGLVGPRRPSRGVAAGDVRAAAVRRRRVPPDELQVEIRDDDGRFLGRGDLGWRLGDGRWLIAEIDGREFHETPEARAARPPTSERAPGDGSSRAAALHVDRHRGTTVIPAAIRAPWRDRPSHD